MTRREFLKGTAGLVLGVGAGFLVKQALGPVGAQALGLTAEQAPAPPSAVEASIGPMLVEGLTLTPTPQGADVYVADQKAFLVNETGLRLLRRADGRHSMETLVDIAGGEASAEQTALFFVTLGEAGYLQNRLEVSFVEARA